MRDDTWEKRLAKYEKERGKKHDFPCGMDSGDPIHPAWAVKDLQERIKVRISWHPGDGIREGIKQRMKTYHASRYYQLSVNPEKPAPNYCGDNTMVVEINKLDLHRALDGLHGTGSPGGNKYLEELWFRHGGT